jgi:hypothetical protein
VSTESNAVFIGMFEHGQEQRPFIAWSEPHLNPIVLLDTARWLDANYPVEGYIRKVYELVEYTPDPEGGRAR